MADRPGSRGRRPAFLSEYRKHDKQGPEGAIHDERIEHVSEWLLAGGLCVAGCGTPGGPPSSADRTTPPPAVQLPAANMATPPTTAPAARSSPSGG